MKCQSDGWWSSQSPDLHSTVPVPVPTSSAVWLELNTNHWAEGKGNRVEDISFLEMGRSPLSLYRDRDLNKTSFACKIFCKAPIKS